MASNIDVAIPPLGSPTTAGVRANFSAAKAEIDELQTAKAIRLQYVATGVELFQQCAVSNVQQPIIFNEMVYNNGAAFNYDAPNGEIEFIKAGYYSILASFQMVRKVGAGSCDWAIHAELKPPAGSFTDFAGSTRIMTLESAVANYKDWRTYTVTARIAEDGTKLRWQQLTTDASKQVGIISYPASGDLPSAAGFVLSIRKAGAGL